MDVRSYHKVLMITMPPSISPQPGRKGGHPAERHRSRHRLGVAQPKVGILSAWRRDEQDPFHPRCRGAVQDGDRGQIKGALVDGPLAFDNAISKAAAKTKGIASAVAGDVDILLAPDLESGNMLAKQLSFLANGRQRRPGAGARVPVVLTSRADSVRARLRARRRRAPGACPANSSGKSS